MSCPPSWFGCATQRQEPCAWPHSRFGAASRSTSHLHGVGGEAAAEPPHVREGRSPRTHPVGVLRRKGEVRREGGSRPEQRPLNRRNRDNEHGLDSFRESSGPNIRRSRLTPQSIQPLVSVNSLNQLCLNSRTSFIRRAHDSARSGRRAVGGSTSSQRNSRSRSSGVIFIVGRILRGFTMKYLTLRPSEALSAKWERE